MQINALLVQQGWDYEGSSTTAVFSHDDELGACGHVIEQMATFPVKPDYYQIVAITEGSIKVRQRWSRQYNTMNNDSYWLKEI
jgi:hypothetical protein